MMRFAVPVVLFAAIVAAPATAQLTWFNNQTLFETANAGNVLDGIENFEESNLPPAEVLGFDDPLQSGVPAGPYPGGLTGLANLTIQSNLMSTGGDTLNPRGGNALVAASAGFGGFGIVSDVQLANTFVDGLDIIFGGAGQVAVGGDVNDLLGSGNVNIRVYDTANNFLGEMSVPGNAGGTNFTGVNSTVAIGRLNLFTTGASGAEGLDNIQAYTPEPASLSLLVLGGLALLRRRG